jgi:hypothetical protein
MKRLMVLIIAAMVMGGWLTVTAAQALKIGTAE